MYLRHPMSDLLRHPMSGTSNIGCLVFFIKDLHSGHNENHNRSYDQRR